MNCAEVMECMHRYLDHDLSQDEMIEMFRHIDDCPSCADVFDRLTMLSQQLEHLPDVKAPFSLVDSIMPQLDELDRGSREQSGASSGEQGMIPFSRKSARGKMTKGNSMASRTGIGAVAAAVILIIALFNMPDKMPGAEVEQLTKSAASSADSSEAARKMDSGSANTADGTNMDSNDKGMFSTEQSPMPAVEGDTAPAVAAGSSTPAVTPEARMGAVPAKSDEPVSDKVASPTKQTPKSTDATPQATDASAFNSSEANPNKSEPTAENNAAADTAAPLQETMKVPADPQGIMSMLPNLVSSQPSWTSPDGRYAAELAGQQLVIYSLAPNGSEEGKLAVTSYPLSGTWVSGEWSPDSLQFTYVTEQAGAEVTKVYIVQAEAATSSPTPTVTPGSTTSPTSSTK
ncbi:zf-HC2 domain-containing protein [Paenibacillus monticola]|uniref:Anti-sigma-W factor RsiW n=1 Tax=Paenibacillus monticola TaxID=2666075 RepID=A0A7X2H976_9BACL|nr:zf-HC2 domain-containing protein [Paenibacillus monticola]MRN55771.1 hypothetical protein [Paenibacillus monticola]